MLRGLIKKNLLIVSIAISMFLIPVLVEGSMNGSKKGGHMTSSYNPYNYSSNYYGRYDSALGLYGSILGGGLYGGVYGGSGLNQIVSNEYSTEQSQTYYIPGGEYTTSISKTTEISTIPTYGALYNPYNFFGLGSFGGFGGWY